MTPQNTYRPATLLTLLTGKKEDLDLVRRRIGYRRLVLLSHPGTHDLAESVREHEGRGIVHIDHLDPSEAIDQLHHLRAIVRRERRRIRKDPRIVLNAAGGDVNLVLAMLLLAYEEGHETWFIQEGRHEKLPILKGVTIRHRLHEDETSVLRSLPPDGTTSSELAQQIILPRTRIEGALRNLEKKDLVTLYPHEGRVAARPTKTGNYLQGHLKEKPGNRPEE